MTNYEAILKMDPARMESFLDQVYLAGLNTGSYAARLEETQQEELLGINPFDMAWLKQPAEAALVSQEDDYVLNALMEEIFRILAKHPPEDEGSQNLVDAVEETCLAMEAELRHACMDPVKNNEQDESQKKCGVIEEIDQIAQNADFVVNGFAYICRDEKVRVINLNDTTRTAVLDRVGNVLQTNMYDIEVGAVQTYWEKNKQFVEQED